MRGYVRRDFSGLLKELHKKPGGHNPKKNKKVSKKEPVSLARRKRDSLMNNPRMLYAYSRNARTLHDRDCIRLGEIPDSEFQMLSEYDAEMNACPCCYRRALIRSGVGDDRRHISYFEHFFGAGHVSNDELYVLMIENNAQLKWVCKDVVQIKVREDTWRISCNEDGYLLWHNNYICNDDGTRCLISGFHPQTVHPWHSLSRILFEWVVSYSWEKHVEKAASGTEEPVSGGTDSHKE